MVAAVGSPAGSMAVVAAATVSDRLSAFALHLAPAARSISDDALRRWAGFGHYAAACREWISRPLRAPCPSLHELSRLALAA